PGDPAYQPRAEKRHRSKPSRPPNLIRDSYSVKFGFQKIVVPHQALVVASFTPGHASQRSVIACSRRVVEVSYVSELPIPQRDLSQSYVRAKARRIQRQRAVKAIRRALEVQPLEERFADSLQQIRLIARKPRRQSQTSIRPLKQCRVFPLRR